MIYSIGSLEFISAVSLHYPFLLYLNTYQHQPLKLDTKHHPLILDTNVFILAVSLHYPFLNTYQHHPLKLGSNIFMTIKVDQPS